MMKPSAMDIAPPGVTAATVWRDVPEPNRSLTTDFFKKQINAALIVPFCHQKDFYSRLVLDVLEIHGVERGRISCFATVKPAVTNVFSGLHGGAVAAIAEVVSMACARTVVAGDKDLFLGELAMSYLAAAPQNAKLIVNASVMRSGRNITVIGISFKMNKTSMLVYAARATFYTIPVAKL